MPLAGVTREGILYSTFQGTMHIVVTFLIVPLTIGTPLLIGCGLKKEKIKLGVFSIMCGIALFIMGGVTAVFYANKLPYFGLMERINIGILLMWISVLSIMMYLTVRQKDKR